jgi:hypothetical protein
MNNKRDRSSALVEVDRRIVPGENPKRTEGE